MTIRHRRRAPAVPTLGRSSLPGLQWEHSPHSSPRCSKPSSVPMCTSRYVTAQH